MHSAFLGEKESFDSTSGPGKETKKGVGRGDGGRILPSMA